MKHRKNSNKFHSKSTLEELFDWQLSKVPILSNISIYQRQYKVSREVVGDEAGVRKRLQEAGLKDWAIDFAWLGFKLGIEIQGGTWKPGTGHNTGTGIQNDCTKQQQCSLMGWTIIPVTGDDVRSGKALKFVEDYINMSMMVK